MPKTQEAKFVVPTVDLIVNSCGEVFHGRKLIVSSVPHADLAARLGRAPSDADFDAEFDRLVDAALPRYEADFVRSVWGMQRVNDGRFRAYGMLDAAGPLAILVTEFCNWIDDDDYWQWLYRTAIRCGATICPMDERKHLDKFKLAGNDHWQTGPDHGRCERQVEFIVDITGFAEEAIVARRDAIARATEDAWQMSGVGVL